eukprot:COSAG02_NODE_24233_length_694_cov_1.085714_2_plen_55_part_01
MWKKETVCLSAMNRCLHEIGNDDTEEAKLPGRRRIEKSRKLCNQPVFHFPNSLL